MMSRGFKSTYGKLVAPAQAGAQFAVIDVGPRPRNRFGAGCAPGRRTVVLSALAFLPWAGAAPHAQPAAPSPPPNLIQISDRLTTSGQPSAAWLRTLKQQGFDAVIYLAPPTVPDAIKEEPEIVRSQGLAFVNIPIVFSNPTESDFETYSRTLRSFEGKRMFVHCQVNMRASVMTFLFRVIHRKHDPAGAYDAVTRVWQPDGPWKTLIRQQLRKHAIAFDPF